MEEYMDRMDAREPMMARKWPVCPWKNLGKKNPTTKIPWARQRASVGLEGPPRNIILLVMRFS